MSNNDELLRKLASLAREDDSDLDPSWDEVAAGRLSEAELARLREQTPDGDQVAETFRPLDAAFRGRMVDQIQASLKESATSTPETANTPSTSKSTPEPIPEPAPQVAEFEAQRQRFSRRRWPALALAASLVMAAWLLAPFFLAKPLPEYSLEAKGAATQRGEETPDAFLLAHPGARLEIVLRPNQQADGKIDGRAFALIGPSRTAPKVQLWDTPLDIAPSGSVRLRGIVDQDLHLPPGTVGVALVAGRPGRLPSAKQVRLALSEEPSSPEAWRLGLVYLETLETLETSEPPQESGQPEEMRP